MTKELFIAYDCNCILRNDQKSLIERLQVRKYLEGVSKAQSYKALNGDSTQYWLQGSHSEKLSFTVSQNL